MNLGDIKGAFLEAGPLPDKYRPLFARQPEGGIPGLHPDDVLEITGNMYGANNAPQEWYRTFDAEARAAGFQRSAFDNCLYFFRGEDARLCGVWERMLTIQCAEAREERTSSPYKGSEPGSHTGNGESVMESFAGWCTART